MGASVGVGGLIVGISMLVVFSMAITTLDSQTAASLDAIESAHTPDPIIKIDSAQYLKSIHTISIDNGGTGYTDGTLISADCPGFEVQFTVINGVISAIDPIVNRGVCNADPASVSVQNQLGGQNAAFDVDVQRYLHVEVTNDGSETLSTDEAWFFFDGSSPVTMKSTDFTPSIVKDNWFSGETISLITADEAPNPLVSRLSLIVGETSVS
jgi:archaellum component FlaF (FlaF/FlaG flagellin family)